MLPETTSLAEILLYLGVLQEEAEEETGDNTVAQISINSNGMCCVTDSHSGDRYLTITKLLIDMRQTLD